MKHIILQQKKQNVTTETDLEKINFDKEEIKKSFLTTITNSNFFVLKCYKLVIDFNNFFKNKGRIIITIILTFFIIFIFGYIFKDRKAITNYITSIINNKINGEKKN